MLNLFGLKEGVAIEAAKTTPAVAADTRRFSVRLLVLAQEARRRPQPLPETTCPLPFSPEIIFCFNLYL